LSARTTQGTHASPRCSYVNSCIAFIVDTRSKKHIYTKSNTELREF